VMDSASPNRSAMQLLDEDADVHPLVNLQCAAPTLSLLMRDLYKRFDWVRNVYTTASFISTTVMGDESYRTIFQQQVMLDQGRTGALSSHFETRFGSHFLVLKSVLRCTDSLVSMVGSQPFLQFVKQGKESAVKVHHLLLGQYGCMKRAPVLEKLCQPIMDAMTTVEADHA
jgi:hypothetical protein